MKGFPKILNSKEDYEYVRVNFATDQWRPHWQALLDTMCDWFFVKNLEEDEQPPEGSEYKVVEDESIDHQTTTRALYKYQENPAAQLYRLGFTKEYVQSVLDAAV